jgi:hypothetical protein
MLKHGGQLILEDQIVKTTLVTWFFAVSLWLECFVFGFFLNGTTHSSRKKKIRNVIYKIITIIISFNTLLVSLPPFRTDFVKCIAPT